MKILMVGNKDSGKTTYMTASFGKLEGGVENFFVDTDDDSKQWFQQLFRSIKNGGYPSPTDKRHNYNLSLYYRTQKILDFEWVDYHGGVTTEKDVASFKEDINSSAGIMIFLEAQALWQNCPFVHKLRRIISLIQEHLENYDKPLLSVIIVLTKYDTIPADVSFEEVTKDLNGFMSAANNNDKIYASIVPISCTAKALINVELPLLDVLDSGLRVDYLSNVFAAKESLENANRCEENASLIDRVVSFFTGTPTYDQLAKFYREQAQERVKMFKALETPIENLRQYISNYKITYPNVDTTNPSTTCTSRRRFIEF